MDGKGSEKDYYPRPTHLPYIPSPLQPGVKIGGRRICKVYETVVYIG